jgi:hypothetical protein
MENCFPLSKLVYISQQLICKKRNLGFIFFLMISIRLPPDKDDNEGDSQKPCRLG